MTKAIDYKAVHVSPPTKAKSENWQDTADKWQVSINGQKFDYYTGIGHRTLDTMAKYRVKTGLGVNSFQQLLAKYNLKTTLEYSKPVPPKLDDVLHSLVMDSSACEESFDDWCSDYGYDTDPRKALDLYLQCQENATKLRKAGINIAAERERLQDY